jgi:hypothetical protein
MHCYFCENEPKEIVKHIWVCEDHIEKAAALSDDFNGCSFWKSMSVCHICRESAETEDTEGRPACYAHARESFEERAKCEKAATPIGETIFYGYIYNAEGGAKHSGKIKLDKKTVNNFIRRYHPPYRVVVTDLTDCLVFDSDTDLSRDF